MAKKKQKYYVVWKGKQTGVFHTWEECKAQTEGFAGAKYKSFETESLAEQAYRSGPAADVPSVSKQYSVLTSDSDGLTVTDPSFQGPLPELNAIAVDAACSGNPGVMEYRGVYIKSRTELFHFKAPVGTNNIGEFLGIVHGLAYLKKNHLDLVLYSDSRNAINWVKARQCRTKLPITPDTEKLYNIIQRAENWLQTNTYSTQIRKWETELWGEIPADFGRKG